MDAEMEATRMDTSGGEASAEDVATRAAPRHAIRYSELCLSTSTDATIDAVGISSSATVTVT